MLPLVEDVHRFERIWAVDGALADGSGRVRQVYSVELVERLRSALCLQEFPKES